MKRLLISSFMVLALAGLGYSTIHYVDCSSDGGGDGTTTALKGANCAFKTLAEVNAHTFVAGDYCYFKRGETWSDTQLGPTHSGSAGSPITYGAYGMGDRPIISRTGPTQYCIYASSKSYLTFENLDLRSTDYRVAMFQDSGSFDHITINNCKLTQVNSAGTTENIIYFYASTDGHTISDITIKNNEITGNGAHGGNGFYIKVWGLNVYNLTFTGNNFHDIHQNAIQIDGDLTRTGVGGKSPYGVVIDHNTFTDVHCCAISLQAGFGETSPNSFSYNTLLRIGDAGIANINAVQLSWARNTIIEHNTIDTVLTSVPDGDAIILDFAWTNSTYDSEGAIVRYNRATGCNSAYSSGVNAYHCKNCQIYYNVSYGNTCGFRVVNSDSTGNVFYNNTAYGNTYGAYIDTNSPASTWKNNILAGNITYGFAKHVTATAPTEDHNCTYGGTNLITLDGTDITVNPNFVAPTATPPDFHLQPGSPCVDHGISVSLTRDYDGLTVVGLPDIGAFEFRPQYHIVH